MAGARIQLDIEARSALEALGELLDRVEDPRPAFRDIGEYLDLAHRDRWDAQKAPDGTPWAPLSEVTKKRKTRNRDKILVESGDLQDLLRYDVSLEELLFGTNQPYGAVQQFGAKQGEFGQNSRGAPIPWGDIPARPWLGLADEDEEPVLEILERHLMG